MTAGPAQAADEVSKSENLNADQLKRLAGLPEDQRNGIRDRLNQELAKGVCANPASVLPWAWGIARRSPLKHSERFSPPPRKGLGLQTESGMVSYCAGLAAAKVSGAALTACSAESLWKKFSPIAGAVARTVISAMPGGQVVLGTVDTVAFIANAKDGFEKFANTVKAEGVKTTNEVLNNLLKVSSFQVDDGFRATWATFAGIGIIVMALMYFKLWKDVSNEDIDLDSARDALFWYGPLSIILVLFGPPLGYVINGWLTQATEAYRSGPPAG